MSDKILKCEKYFESKKLCNYYVMIENSCIENVKSYVMIINSYIRNVKNYVMIEKSCIEVWD